MGKEARKGTLKYWSSNILNRVSGKAHLETDIWTKIQKGRGDAHGSAVACGLQHGWT